MEATRMEDRPAVIAPTEPAPPSVLRIAPRARTPRASTVWAMWRMTRASLWFALIVSSYLFQKAFARVLGERLAAARWERVHARNARRLYRACVGMRGVYIKMGQVLSIMGTFLPPVYARELEALQDKVPARPFKDIDKAIAASLGARPHVLFASFDETPVAAASLGQVHRATTHDGEEVAVKVLYPNVEAIMRLDLRVIGWALAVYRRFVPIAQLERLHAQLTEMLEQETDLSHEARCLTRMGACFADDPNVLVPEPRPALSSNRVLTMTFMEGVKVSDRDALARLGLEPQAVARKLVEAFYKNLLIDGFFHADPHPGNFFAQRGPHGEVRIVMLDLGSATPVHAPLVDGMMTILGGFMAKDDAMVMAGVETMGFVAEGGDRELLERTVKQYFQKLLNLDISDFGNIGIDQASELADPGLRRRELRKLMRSVSFPEGWFYLERAAVILFGLSGQLAPRLNLAQVGFPFVARYLATRGPRRTSR
ncbi:MAG: AarF/ABC1/UbiB kinase family protein [Deltaproteobacteria bacterium]|nr:MAG: AarF/ABC1/UbiB kinase family protein [Deltaproteobacteria bacterium]